MSEVWKPVENYTTTNHRSGGRSWIVSRKDEPYLYVGDDSEETGELELKIELPSWLRLCESWEEEEPAKERTAQEFLDELTYRIERSPCGCDGCRRDTIQDIVADWNLNYEG